jgi:hypothetical protein
MTGTRRLNKQIAAGPGQLRMAPPLRSALGSMLLRALLFLQSAAGSLPRVVQAPLWGAQPPAAGTFARATP